MDEQKILNTDQISWYDEDKTQLNYQVAFEGDGGLKQSDNGSSNNEEDKQEIDLRALIRKKDEKWKKRLEKVRESAFAKGIEQGKEIGYRKAEQEIDEKLAELAGVLKEGHQQWIERQEALNPGMLDLVFDLAEQIVGLPVEHPELRQKLDEELSVLLHEVEAEVKPVLWVCEEDHAYVEELIQKYAPEVTVSIRISDKYNPGEFEFETDKETVVHSFKEMLSDFRENLSVPSWK